MEGSAIQSLPVGITSSAVSARLTVRALSGVAITGAVANSALAMSMPRLANPARFMRCRRLGILGRFTAPEGFVPGERPRPEADRNDVSQQQQDQEHCVAQANVISQPAD